MAEDSLRDIDAGSRLVLVRIPGIILFINPAGELEFVNRTATAFFGNTLEELRHWWMEGTVHPDDRAHVFEIFTRATVSSEPYQFEVRFRRYNASYRWFECRVKVMTWQD